MLNLNYYRVMVRSDELVDGEFEFSFIEEAVLGIECTDPCVAGDMFAFLYAIKWVVLGLNEGLLIDSVQLESEPYRSGIQFRAMREGKYGFSDNYRLYLVQAVHAADVPVISAYMMDLTDLITIFTPLFKRVIAQHTITRTNNKETEGYHETVIMVRNAVKELRENHKFVIPF